MAEPAVVLRDDDEVFVIRVTGEVVATYSDYLAKLRGYRERTHTCRFTGKTGLTLEEARVSEEQSAVLLSKVGAAEAEADGWQRGGGGMGDWNGGQPAVVVGACARMCPVCVCVPPPE